VTGTPEPVAPAGSAPATVQALLDRFPAESPPVSIAGAAVTMVLRQGRAEVETLLIERAVQANDPASGQVAFPGGHVADGDGSLLSTALRELEEEVGLTEGDLAGPPRFVGATPAPRFRMTVGVFAARLGEAGRPPTVRSSAEVAHVFWLPRSALARTDRVHRETPSGLTPVNATVYERHILWGFSRRVIRDFFGLPREDVIAGPVFSERRSEDPVGGSEDGAESSPP
jgi:8-oxo-dGTP pyrophosphatase MutT (NUDIX family)